MRRERSIPWVLIGAVLVLVAGTGLLFSRASKMNTTSPTSTLPLPGTAMSTLPALSDPIDPLLSTGGSLYGETSPAGACHLALDIPWEHDASNPITDENEIMVVLRALGDLEECLFARQEGWLHYYVIRDGLRTENEVLAHLTEGGEFVDLRYDLKYAQGKYTAKPFYDGRLAENQWCNISDEPNKRVIQAKRNCTPTEVYSLLTGNNVVNGYVGENFYTFLASKKFPSPAPGYYLPRIWFTQANDVALLVIESKHDMTDVGYGQDTTEKPLKAELRRTTIDLDSGRMTKYYSETTFKNGTVVMVTEDVFLVYYLALPEDIASAIRLSD